MSKEREQNAREHINELIDDPIWFEWRYGRLSLDFWREASNICNIRKCFTTIYHFHLASQKGAKFMTFDEFIDNEYPHLKEILY